MLLPTGSDAQFISPYAGKTSLLVRMFVASLNIKELRLTQRSRALTVKVRDLVSFMRELDLSLRSCHCYVLLGTSADNAANRTHSTVICNQITNVVSLKSPESCL